MKDYPSQKFAYNDTLYTTVNAIPHIGSAYTTIVADVLARFKRLQGQEVLLITGDRRTRAENSAHRSSKRTTTSRLLR